MTPREAMHKLVVLKEALHVKDFQECFPNVMRMTSCGLVRAAGEFDLMTGTKNTPWWRLVSKTKFAKRLRRAHRELLPDWEDVLAEEDLPEGSPLRLALAAARLELMEEVPSE